MSNLEGNNTSPGKMLNMLKDYEQRHQWLRQEAHLAHQSASIERLEDALECQRRAMSFQSRNRPPFNRQNRHRGVKNGSKAKNWQNGHSRNRKSNNKKCQKRRNNIIERENDGNNLKII